MPQDLSDMLVVRRGAAAANASAPSDPYARWRADPTPSNMNAVLDDLSTTINSEIQRFSGPKTLLKSRARALAIKAVRSYDPASGANLRSWVTTQLMPLSRYNNSLKPVYAPEDVSRKAYTISVARETFRDEHGRDPTDAELADEVGISVKRLRAVLGRTPAVVNEPDADPDEATQDLAIYTSNPIRDAQEAVYASLDDRDKAIFDGRTGLHGAQEMSGKALADMLKVSPAFVSQRAAAIAGRVLDAGLALDRNTRGAL